MVRRSGTLEGTQPFILSRYSNRNFKWKICKEDADASDCYTALSYPNVAIVIVGQVPTAIHASVGIPKLVRFS